MEVVEKSGEQRPMLSVAERAEIEKEIHHYENRQAACIEAMKIVQKHRGWVSDEGIRDIATIMEMTPAELDSVATFYNLIFRKPVGRHVILICDSVSCWIMGYEQIREHLMKKLGIGMGETTPDGRFTLLPVCCLGTCDRAPAMMIGEDLHQDLTPEKIDTILDSYI
jgi:NADH-quinone oxidoreductase subunit E